MTGQARALDRGPRDGEGQFSGSSIKAAPAPVFRTLRTGHPMLRSMIAAPASATIAAAERIASGSGPKSWIETGPSSGWIRSISSRVRSLP